LKFSIDENAIATVHMTGGSDFTILGTAFCFIKSNWYMTAKHVVVEDDQVKSGLKIVTHSPNKPVGLLNTPKRVYYHDELDIAIIEMHTGLCQKPHFPGHHDFVGKQGLVKVAYSPSQTKERNRVIFNATHIKDYQTEIRNRNYGDETLFSFSDLNAETGNSGAPLIGEAGNIVGVIIDGFYGDNQELNRALATDVQAMLSVLTLNIGSDDGESTVLLKHADITL